MDGENQETQDLKDTLDNADLYYRIYDFMTKNKVKLEQDPEYSNLYRELKGFLNLARNEANEPKAGLARKHVGLSLSSKMNPNPNIQIQDYEQNAEFDY